MLKFVSRLWGRTAAVPAITAIVIDPFDRAIQEVRIPTYRAEPPDWEPLDPGELALFSAAVNRCINPDGREGFVSMTTSFRNDCPAVVDDFGLLHDDAAYWRLEIGDYRPVRGGRYCIYGSDGSPLEQSIPNDLGLRFWQTHVRWVDKAEGRQLCGEIGVSSPSWKH